MLQSNVSLSLSRWKVPPPHDTIHELQLSEQRQTLHERIETLREIKANAILLVEPSRVAQLENEIASIRRTISWYERFLDTSLRKKPKKKKPRTTAPPVPMAPVDQSSSVARGGASLSQSSGGDLADPQPFEFVEPMSSGTSSSAAYGGGASSSAMASVARGGADPVPSFMAPVVQSSSVARGGTSSSQLSGGDLASSSAAYGGGASSSAAYGGASSFMASDDQSLVARDGGGAMVDSKSL